MQTFDSQQPRMAYPRTSASATPAAPGTPGSRPSYDPSRMPQAPGLPGPGLPDYDAARTRVRGLNTNLYTRQDMRRAGGQAQTAGNAQARAAMARMAASGGNMGSGAAALVGGSLYGAAAMAGLDASRGMDLENRRGQMEGEFRREGMMSAIDQAQQSAAIGSTSLNQNAANANRDFDYRAFADEQDRAYRDRRAAFEEAEIRRRAQQDDWRFRNEQQSWPYDPANPMNPRSPMNPASNYTMPGTNNSSSASWAARNPYRRF